MGEGKFYRSCICDETCDHRHRTFEAAERCAAERIAGGELRRRMGDHKPLKLPAAELENYVSIHHKEGMRIG